MAQVGFTYYSPSSGPLYLNKNIWLSLDQFVVSRDPSDPDHFLINNTEVNQPLSNEKYWAQAVLCNKGTAYSGPVTVSFFLADPATQFDLSKALWHVRATGTNGIGPLDPSKPPEHQVNFFSLQVPIDFSKIDTQGRTHFCLVAVWETIGVANAYVDQDGNALPGVIANMASNLIAQHNIDIVEVSNGGSSFTGINVMGLPDGAPSALVTRIPDRVEYDAIVNSLGDPAVGLKNVTTESLAGFVAGSGHDSEGLLPRLNLKDLEPGCIRKVQFGVRMPKNTNENERSASFHLVEQVRVTGELVGGVVVVGMEQKSSC